MKNKLFTMQGFKNFQKDSLKIGLIFSLEK